MVELINVEDFGWIDTANPPLNGSTAIDIVNSVRGGGGVLGGPTIGTGSTSWVTVSNWTSNGSVGTNNEFWEHGLALKSVGRPDEKHYYGNFYFSATMPLIAKYRTGKTCFGMNLPRSATISSNPGAVYISSGMSGSGAYIFPATTLSQLFIEVEIDWDAGALDVYYNSTKVVSYTFTREITSTAYPANTIQVYFCNYYSSSYLTGGSSTTLTSFWSNTSAYCWPSSYYCAHDEAGTSPRMGRVRVCSPVSTLGTSNPVTVASTGLTFSPSADTKVAIDTCVAMKSYINPSSGSQQTEVTPSAKSAGKATLQVSLPDIGNLPNYVVVGAALTAKAINPDPTTTATVKLTLDCGGSKVLSDKKEIDTSSYGIRSALPITLLDSLPTSSVKDISGKLEIV